MVIPTTPEIVATGDHSIRKESEKLAALAAVYQLHGLDLVRFEALDIYICDTYTFFALRRSTVGKCHENATGWTAPSNCF